MWALKNLIFLSKYQVYMEAKKYFVIHKKQLVTALHMQHMINSRKLDAKFRKEKEI